jgi:hypothetical protein
MKDGFDPTTERHYREYVPAAHGWYVVGIDHSDTPVSEIHWVIVGGEFGPKRRPMDLAWMRALRDQCFAAGIPFFGKQWDKVKDLPADLMVRQFPVVRAK